MPTYEYECDACEHAFEQFQSITAGPLKKCPKCGKNKLRRLISAGGGILFKGSGFYETDYRSDSYKKAAEAETKPASDSSGDKKDGGKSDAKPDAKPDGKSESKGDAKTDVKPPETVKTPAVEKQAATKSGTKPESRPSKSARKK